MDLPDLRTVRAILCDADGTLFPSEEPAFVASADVTNDALAELGVDRAVTAEGLRLGTTGKNFRTTLGDLARESGARLDEATLERWVQREKEVVTAYLGRHLTEDPAVTGPLSRLGQRCTLAAVSSSALARLAASFTATGLADLIPPERRFSAEDSLPRPTSKPDPAVYLHAGRELGVGPDEAVAVEDSVPGAGSAVAAGYPTIGIIAFVPEDERDDRRRALEDAGVVAVVESWAQVEELLLPADVRA